MKILYSVLILLVLFACGEVGEDIDSKTERTQTEDGKEFVIEEITRTYPVNNENGEPKKDTLTQMVSITRDSEGREIEKTFYKVDGSIASIEKYIFDEDGKLIGSDYFDKGTDNTIYYAYEVDSKGRKTSYQAFDHGSDAMLFEGTIRYEDFGKLKKDGYLDENGNFICSFEYTFDDEGKELGYTYIADFTGERFSSTYTYIEYNDDQQWTKRHVVKNSEVSAIETREFKKIEIE